MTAEVDSLVGAGDEALKAGEWRAAEASYRSALDLAETGEALFGLGISKWWLGETGEALRCWERAYAAVHRTGAVAEALIAAVYLCLAFRMSMGNDAAAHGWLGRAASLVEEFDLRPMNAWVLLCRAYVANDGGQPHAAHAWAQEALDLARGAGDVDLALCAACELGAALIQTGRVEEGTDLLDQAMADALAGDGHDLDAVVLISCRTITSCVRAADIKRAIQWIRAADDFNRRYGSAHLYTTCRTHYGSVLFAVGRWAEAEAELDAALTIGAHSEPVLQAEAAAKLAELRLAQGRIEDAEQLISGHHDQPATTYVGARLQLARGAATAAASLVRRRLRDLDEQCVDAVVLEELLAEAEIAQGRPPTLAGHEGPAQNGSGLAVAHRERAIGRVLAAVGDGAAVAHLEKALSTFAGLEMPYECARTRLLLSQVVPSNERETAIHEARAALTSFEKLGADRDADAAASLLRSLGVKAARAGPKGLGLLTKREREILALLAEGLSNPDIAERLFLSRKTVEHHVANVLTKLGLRTRGEAAAYAVRGAIGSSGQK